MLARRVRCHQTIGCVTAQRPFGLVILVFVAGVGVPFLERTQREMVHEDRSQSTSTDAEPSADWSRVRSPFTRLGPSGGIFIRSPINPRRSLDGRLADRSVRPRERVSDVDRLLVTVSRYGSRARVLEFKIPDDAVTRHQDRRRPVGGGRRTVGATY